MLKLSSIVSEVFYDKIAELLAVIVILALLIVITANTVLPMMNRSRRSAMVIYADNVLKRAGEAYIVDSLTNGGSKKYYSIEQLMGQDDYFGVVMVEMVENKYSYSIAMFDQQEEVGLNISNVKSSTIEGSIDSIVSTDYYVYNNPDSFDTHDECEGFLGFPSPDSFPNIIKYYDVKEGHFISGLTGNIISSGNWVSSDYIKVVSGRKYKYILKSVSSASGGYAWYDKDKNKISASYLSATDSFIEIEAPSGAEYLRVSWRIINNSDWKKGSVRLELIDS